MWVLLVIFSALFLGVYDVFKKISVKDNVVVLVLFEQIFDVRGYFGHGF